MSEKKFGLSTLAVHAGRDGLLDLVGGLHPDVHHALVAFVVGDEALGTDGDQRVQARFDQTAGVIRFMRPCSFHLN